VPKVASLPVREANSPILMVPSLLDLQLMRLTILRSETAEARIKCEGFIGKWWEAMRER
jgi:hypothetical protein